jgi:hypothetical protein
LDLVLFRILLSFFLFFSFSLLFSVCWVVICSSDSFETCSSAVYSFLACPSPPFFPPCLFEPTEPSCFLSFPASTNVQLLYSSFIPSVPPSLSVIDLEFRMMLVHPRCVRVPALALFLQFEPSTERTSLPPEHPQLATVDSGGSGVRGRYTGSSSLFSMLFFVTKELTGTFPPIAVSRNPRSDELRLSHEVRASTYPPFIPKCHRPQARHCRMRYGDPYPSSTLPKRVPVIA